MIKLSKSHPARRIQNGARILTRALCERRYYGPTCYSEAVEREGAKAEAVVLEVAREASEVETIVAAAAADGKFTAEEHDAIVSKLREMGTELEEGRVL